MSEIKKTGLPDISELKRPKNILVVVLVLLIVITVIVVTHFMKSEKKQVNATEETYTVQPVVTMEGQPQNIGTTSTQPVSQVQVASQLPDTREMEEQKLALIQQKQKELEQRLIAPLMLVNTNTNANASSSNNNNSNDNSANQMAARDPNTRFMQQASAQSPETANAVSIGPLNTVIAEGSFIHATLEPAINSDLPGHLRASVSVPVYSEDGSQVLIPPGSRLLGQYQSGMLQGQSRIFVVWTRLITPNGLSVQLGSPGVDSLGVAGMEADEINRHFWQRFGIASLLSLIDAGTSNVGVSQQDQNNPAAMYREAIASSFAQSANQSLQQQGGIPPTLIIHQGKDIMVFVAKDLHFADAIKQTKPSINVF